MTSRDEVRFGETTIEYQVRRSQRRRKTVQITVDGNGVHVTAPATTPDRELRSIVRKRAAWIVRHAHGAPLSVPQKRFVSGETLPYLGRNVRMVFESAKTRRALLRFDHWRFRITVPEGLSDQQRYQRIRHVVIDWYRNRAAQRLPETVDRWWPQLGRGDRPQILIRDQRRRWGSCAADGTLRFNWRAMMLEPSLIDYIVVHELAHLTIRNHSEAFWALVYDAMPDSQVRRRRLREAGCSLPL